ncbi:hypothetical protein LIER_28646 [Lithospermum erythrorhizon]|uniref:Retrotransposon gag domain-containing protein n=1 Tax=Lithospermum erythrorhizon TaxID=34254 RepID=A0AAV3RHZ5_LITER
MDDNDRKIEPTSPYFLGRFVFVDGTIQKLTENRKLLNWETVNSMLMSWILCSLDSKLASTVPDFEEAKPLWDYLEKRFSVANGPRLQQLRKDITICRQTKGMALEDYYNKLAGLFDELARLKPPTHARVASARMELLLVMKRIGRKSTCINFLWGLMINFTDENSKTVVHKSAEPDSFYAFAIPSDRPLSRYELSKLNCTHCRQSSHDHSSCFKLHGYPPWWEERQQ